MKTFRSILFWFHLAAGLIAGLAIAIMCFTGAVLAFDSEITAWSERDARSVTPSVDAKRQSLAELQQQLRATQPEFRVSGITLLNDPTVAVAFTGSNNAPAFYGNPYTGELRQPGSTRVRDFMRTMRQWHTALGRQDTQRVYGKTINDAGNFAFLFLAVSGLYLWWPRPWSWRGFKSVALLNFNFKGKARDFNWHNSIGLWCAPVLIVLTLTAIPMSYRWGGTLISRMVGEEPTPTGAPANPEPAITIARPSANARPLAYDSLVARAQQDFPSWEQMAIRLGSSQRGGQRSPENGPQPVTLTIREAGSWPRTATTTLTINPFTGEILKSEGYADLIASRQVRAWTRFLHTGQALGWGGQLVAGLACLGGCFLVYTGFALSWRRFFRRKTPAP